MAKKSRAKKIILMPGEIYQNECSKIKHRVIKVNGNIVYAEAEDYYKKIKYKTTINEFIKWKIKINLNLISKPCQLH